jgi:hypothetical protein
MSPFELLRDDGPLARALGATLGRSIPVPAIVLLVAGVLPLLAAIAVTGSGSSDGIAVAAVGWLVLAAGTSRGRPHTGSLGWEIPPVLRLAEYASILWLGALAGGSGPAAAFALLAAVAFRHYDLVYRPRFLGASPPWWVSDAGGGWEGRLLGGCVLLLAGELPAGFFTLAGVLGALFVGECIAGWLGAERAGGAVGYADDGVEE